MGKFKINGNQNENYELVFYGAEMTDQRQSIIIFPLDYVGFILVATKKVDKIAQLQIFTVRSSWKLHCYFSFFHKYLTKTSYIFKKQKKNSEFEYYGAEMMELLAEELSNRLNI